MKFTNTAELLKNSRIKAKITQDVVSGILYFKCSQFISNIERGIASLPIEHWRCIATLYQIRVSSIERAYLKDVREHIRETLT